MKTFEITHKILTESPKVIFNEDSPPKWLISHEYRWAWVEHILPMGVGSTFETDFRVIKRVA